jgi:hypothetical protein
VATFFTDSDLTGAGEFVEGEVSLATEFTLPGGTIARFRWRWPTIAPGVTPAIRLYDAGGSTVATVSFDTTTLDAWNWATPGAPISIAAGTYRATVNTTRYPALAGFFGGGPITRGDITAVQGRFASGVAAPTSTSTASYFVDVDFTKTPDVAPTGIAVAAGLGQPAVALLGTAPAGLAAASALGSPAVALGLTAAPSGIAVPVALGRPLEPDTSSPSAPLTTRTRPPLVTTTHHMIRS